MEQQPGRRQPGRQGQGRAGGSRSQRPAEDFVEDDPTMVRPFVKAGPRGRQGPDDGAPGGRTRQGAPGGGQGRPNGRQQPQNGRQQPPNGRQQPQNGRGRQDNPGPDGPRQSGHPSQSGHPGQGVPGPRPPRDTAAHQVPGLVSTPMPAPRAVAGQRRHAQPEAYPEPDPPLSDLTTTMPILAVPADGYDDGYDDRDGYPHPEHENAAPGEHGHFHDDADWGRHRGRNRPPRALKIGAVLAGVAVVGVAAYSVLGGGSGQPSAGPAAGASTANGAAGAAAPSGGATSLPGTPAPTGTPTDSGSDTSSASTPSTSHSSKTPSKPSSTSHPSTSQSLASRPSSTPSTPTTSASSASAPAPPTTPSPTFTVLGPGSSGPAVAQLQQNLKKWGGYWWLRASGTWDANTTTAVENFQDANPGTSPPDNYGYYGPATDKALQAAVG